MNRVVFIFLSILLIVFPLTIENLENENVNYFELVKNITTELIHTVVKAQVKNPEEINFTNCLLYTSPSPRDGLLSRMPSSA